MSAADYWLPWRAKGVEDWGFGGDAIYSGGFDAAFS